MCVFSHSLKGSVMGFKLSINILNTQENIWYITNYIILPYFKYLYFSWKQKKSGNDGLIFENI
jgi:hypothetical protein